MDHAEFLAPFDIGQINRDLAIETPRSQQCRIKNIGAVGGRDDDHAFLGIEAVHFDEQRI